MIQFVSQYDSVSGQSQNMVLVYLSSYRMPMTFFVVFLGGLLTQAQDQSGLIKQNINFIISFFLSVENFINYIFNSLI